MKNVSMADEHEHDEHEQPEQDIYFEPVIKLEQVQTKTHEEDEVCVFKMYVS